MTSVKDVMAHPLILEVAKDLKENKGVLMPEFAVFVKTGSHREKAPTDPDWWFIRMASILRKVYISGNVTVSSLRSYYGGKKRRGVRPAVFRKSGGKIIRVCLQDLEKLGFVKISDDKKGRILTSKGQKYLDSIASKVLTNIKKEEKEEKPKVVTKKPKVDKKEVIKEKIDLLDKNDSEQIKEPEN
ncbi:MAG: 30S ribosomal protein S19e [Candidatus ainarchaeum sp.]|nr:30S ribosomal protein S19e [Candidatus ainarchaeum sp.]MDD3976166.1 30S ribosomal protein S19e [Candidatus ainarchaeum sp.]